jgi:hypothetical protein
MSFAQFSISPMLNTETGVWIVLGLVAYEYNKRREVNPDYGFIFQERMRQYIRSPCIDTDNPVLLQDNMKHSWNYIQGISGPGFGDFSFPLPLSVLQLFRLRRHIRLIY